MVDLNRRSLITGLIGLGVAAPAIIRSASLMPVKVMEPTPRLWTGQLAWMPADLATMTFNWPGHDPQPIYRQDGVTKIKAGDFRRGETVVLAFNGTRWITL